MGEWIICIKELVALSRGTDNCVGGGVPQSHETKAAWWLLLRLAHLHGSKHVGLLLLLGHATHLHLGLLVHEIGLAHAT